MVKRSTTALYDFFKRNVNDKGRLVHGTFPRAVKEFGCCESESSLVTAWLQLRESILCDIGIDRVAVRAEELQNNNRILRYIMDGRFDIYGNIIRGVIPTASQRFNTSPQKIRNVWSYYRKNNFSEGVMKDTVPRTIPSQPHEQLSNLGGTKIPPYNLRRRTKLTSASDQKHILSQLFPDFLSNNPHLQESLKSICQDLFGNGSHHPSKVQKGICLSADSPYNPKNIIVNMKRQPVLRQYFGADDIMNSPNIISFNTKTGVVRQKVSRNTYGVGSGSITIGIPSW
jgi:hypothetical protein